MTEAGNRRTPPRKATPPTRATARSGATPKRAPKPRRTAKGWAWLVVRWLVAAFLALVLVAAVGFFILYHSVSIPNPDKAWQVQTSYVYYDDGKTPIGSFIAGNQNRTSIPYSQMPGVMKNAVVAAEDHTFWTNNGIDLRGIIRAARSNAAGNATQGASTITQQYVKVLYLGESTGHLSYKEKLKEILLALKVHRQLSKPQILEGYLNTIYFGRGAYGIEAAAEAFFHIHAKQLNLKQAAVLGSILNSPGTLDPAGGKDAQRALLARYRYTLTWMAKLGSISASKARAAKKHLPFFPKEVPANSYSGQTGHELTLVKDQLLALGFSENQIDGGGLRVTTTLNKKDMDAMKAGIAQVWDYGPSGLPGLKSVGISPVAKQFHNSLHTAAASVQPGTGALKAFYGGQNYLDSQIDWAVQGGMVGSTMKAVTLATGLENGFSLHSTLQGTSPYTFPDGTTVTNEGQSAGQPYGESYGPVSTIYALQQSINTAFVDMTERIPGGPQKIIANANKMGIPPTKPDSQYPGIPDVSRDLVPDARVTLGRAIISPINMANTYATIAAGGMRSDVHVIQKVTNASGEVLYQFNNKPVRAVPQDVSADDSYALQQVAIGGTGDKNASPADLGRPDAGKTGTATADAPDGEQYVSSAWYVGFTPNLSTAVMYVRGDGNDPLNWQSVTDHNPWMPSFFGADYPAATWNAVMKGELAGTPVLQFPPPANIQGTVPSQPTAPPQTAPPAPTHTAPPAKPSPTSRPSRTVAPPPPPTTTAAPTTPAATPSQNCGVLGCDGGGGGGAGNGGGGGTGGPDNGATSPPAG